MSETMKRTIGVTIWVISTASVAWSSQMIWRYPTRISDMSNLENDCWDAIDRNGNFPLDCSINPNQYLIDAPPTDQTAISITTDRWIELSFPGPITDGLNADIIIREEGTSGENALILLSDGHTRTYPLGIAEIPNTMTQESTICEFDLDQVDCGFIPTAIRIVSLGLGGGSPGFDVGAVQARITVDDSTPYLPFPHDGDTTQADQTLQWFSSGPADAVDVYIGFDPNETDPSLAQPFVTLPGDANSYTPEFLWTFGKTYYWRIVEQQNKITRIGPCWKFTVSPYRTFEDFETYADEEELHSRWRNPQKINLSSDPNIQSNGCHALEFNYSCYSGSQDDTGRTDSPQHDWTDPNLDFVELAFRGKKSNSKTHKLLFGMGNRFIRNVTYDGDPNHMIDGQWHTWRIPLESFGYLKYIDTFKIAIQSSLNTSQDDSTGTIYIDNIRLGSYTTVHPNEPEPLFTDLNQDNHLNFKDLSLFADAWLTSPQDTLSINEPNQPWCFLPFEGSATDSQGNAQTEIIGYLDLPQDANFTKARGTIQITNAQTLQAFTQGISISFWQNGADSIHRTDTLVSAQYDIPFQAPEIAIGLGMWETPEQLMWQCGSQTNPGNLCTGIHQASEHWSSMWNHWAFTKDFTTGVLSVYHNGQLVAQSQGSAEPLNHVDLLEIGKGWYGYYDGLMDDIRIHDYALSAPECAYLATNGTGQLPQPSIVSSDFNQDGQVNWQDFAYMLQEWRK